MFPNASVTCSKKDEKKNRLKKMLCAQYNGVATFAILKDGILKRLT